VPAPKRAKQKLPGLTPVDAIVHGDKRANLPTADAQDFIAPELEQPLPVRYPRDPTLDPQLVWKGKEELDGEDLVAEAPAIYIQEKIDPRVIIENLRRTSKRPEDEPELTLFESFDGLGELDLVDFYSHQANWSNRMILGDSLNVMASLAEREALRGQVQMIYLDPPYGIKFGSNWQVSARRRDVRDGNLADASREVEQIKAFRDTWELGLHSYLSYMRDRLVVARELLAETGSCFVQISIDNAHLVRSLMDEVFGSHNFIAQIGFAKTAGLQSDYLATVNDYLLWYGRSRDITKFRRLYGLKSIGGEASSQYTNVQLPDGSWRPLKKAEADVAALPRGARVFSHQSAYTAGSATTTNFDFDYQGRTYRLPSGQRWRTLHSGMERLAVANRLLVIGNSLRYKRFLDDFVAFPLTDQWRDTAVSGFGDPKVYVVQTNTKVIERCLLMTTDPGDLVVDPTCGGGTTAYVAEQWGRRWITVDTSRVAITLARQRLMGSRFPYYVLADSTDGRSKESSLSSTPLPEAEVTENIRHGFVYERVQHVTLKAIANSPDIRQGMTPDEIDAAIRHNADFELLYDKPYENDRKIRVAGPFTVESLSPHRALAFAGSAVDGPAATNQAAAGTADVTNEAAFVQTILANLRTAGIQNGRKNERLHFDTVDTYATPYIQAIGVREDAAEGAPKRVGITIGPQYGTVGPSFIKDAARAANKASDIDLLCVLAFAFDPSVIGKTDDYITSSEGFAEVAAERRLGRVPVLLVRMNADLVMGEELKKTGVGNLFTVFGEPDIEIKAEGDELRVILHGVDVYDPNTGEIRSDDTSQIALWMIDTEYNDESFFVRECYFTGGQDPYARLKRALKAEIDEEAWSSLNRTESRPFPRPESRKIAVKVINDYGDEVMKVFEVGP
jgi:adenine-specific DNA-methyltransferase